MLKSIFRSGLVWDRGTRSQIRPLLWTTNNMYIYIYIHTHTHREREMERDRESVCACLDVLGPNAVVRHRSQAAVQRFTSALRVTNSHRIATCYMQCDIASVNVCRMISWTAQDRALSTRGCAASVQHNVASHCMKNPLVAFHHTTVTCHVFRVRTPRVTLKRPSHI